MAQNMLEDTKFVERSLDKVRTTVRNYPVLAALLALLVPLLIVGFVVKPWNMRRDQE